MRDAQVVVVGGGPAGSSAAYFLAREGVDVTLVDRARFPRDKVCAEYLSPECSRILDRMGVLSATESSGAAHLLGMRVQSPDGTVMHGDFAANHGFKGFRDRGLAVRRKVLDAILIDRARNAGVKVLENARVTGVLLEQKRVDGVTLVRDGDITELRADVVIGADGLRSVISRRLGLHGGARKPRRFALVTHYTGVAGIDEYGEMFIEREGYCGMVDVGNGVSNVAIVIPVSRGAEVAGDLVDFFEQWIADRAHLAARFTNATRIEPVRATGPFASFAKRSWVPGAALVGDAADFFDPITGEGIYAALRGGELLADTVNEFHGSHSQAAADRALAEYGVRRKAEFSGKWKVERIVGSLIEKPWVFNRVTRTFRKHKEMADLLVGVAGNFVPATEVLRPRYMMNLLLAATFNR
jgi:geranylgeranyl reductase family protein